MNNNQTYPYISAQDRHVNWEFFMTVKPGKRVYLEAISKDQIAAAKKKTMVHRYLGRLARIGTEYETRSKAEAARLFYQDVFGKNAIAKSRLV